MLRLRGVCVLQSGVNRAGGALPVVHFEQWGIWVYKAGKNECTDRSETRNRKAFGGVGRLGADSGR